MFSIYSDLRKYSIPLFLLAFLAGCSGGGGGKGVPGGDQGPLNPEGTPPPTTTQTPTGPTCDASNPKVFDFFSGAEITVQKPFDRYTKYVGHLSRKTASDVFAYGYASAYSRSGEFTAYANRGSTLRVTKGAGSTFQTPGTKVGEDIDLKSPIQSLAFANLGGALKLIAATRSNIQVIDVSGSSLNVVSKTDAVGGAYFVSAPQNDQVLVVNTDGDLFKTAMDGCFYRVYEAKSDVETSLNHPNMAYKAMLYGDNIVFLTRNRKPFDLNLTSMMKLMNMDFLKWKTKARFVKLGDKSAGEINLTTPSTPYVSPSDIATAAGKLFVAVNSFPSANSTIDLYSKFNTCVTTPASCPVTGPLNSAIDYWLYIYMLGDAGVMQFDSADALGSQTPNFKLVEYNFSFPGAPTPGIPPLHFNTGFFYSPRIAVSGDNLYMRGLFGAAMLPNLSQDNTVWQYRYRIYAPPANIDFALPTGLEVSDGILRLTGLEGASDYQFDSDTPKDDVKNNYFTSPLFYLHTGGRNSAIQFNRRFNILNPEDKNIYTLQGGSVVGVSYIKGADEAGDRVMTLERVVANAHLRIFKAKDPTSAVAHDHENIHPIGGSNFFPYLSEYQLMSAIQSDASYTFIPMWSILTQKYNISVVSNDDASLAWNTATTTPAGGTSGLLLATHKLVATDADYILYLSKFDVGPSYKVDRVVISKSSVQSGSPAVSSVTSVDLTAIAATGWFGSIDADAQNLYVLDAKGILTTYNATSGAVVGSPLNVFNFGAAQKIFVIPPSITVHDQKAYINGITFGGGITNIGLRHVIADLASGEVHNTEAQYLMTLGADDRLFGTSMMNENGTEMFDLTLTPPPPSSASLGGGPAGPSSSGTPAPGGGTPAPAGGVEPGPSGAPAKSGGGCALNPGASASWAPLLVLLFLIPIPMLALRRRSR